MRKIVSYYEGKSYYQYKDSNYCVFLEYNKHIDNLSFHHGTFTSYNIDKVNIRSIKEYECEGIINNCKNQFKLSRTITA